MTSTGECEQCDLGVRAPDPDEIPLNEAEVAFGFEHGLI